MSASVRHLEAKEIESNIHLNCSEYSRGKNKQERGVKVRPLVPSACRTKNRTQSNKRKALFHGTGKTSWTPSIERKKKKENGSVSQKFITLSGEGVKILERELEAATMIQLSNKRLSL